MSVNIGVNIRRGTCNVRIKNLKKSQGKERGKGTRLKKDRKDWFRPGWTQD